ncbi:o-succinylbenzoate synthase [Hyalangium rubrum]|uniref:o-succinylbenzoate synthase n=1 Tax=Hyalangium rubrum TaxID=3103134 RepID=A0ABU5HHQ8_9BACT|nr:o-succinylbenzoate synthase [Hyalangium sp. s54d21]MDY7231610.1 o-succinylbenzoate synthase [Hyalangium sp. s54d21]
MRIIETRLAPSRLEFVRPLKTARATYAAREGFLVRLVDEEGRVGQGEAMPLPEFGTESLDTCERVLRGHLARLGEQLIADRLEAIPEVFTEPGTGSSWAPAAAHAVELALLDLLAQRRKVPLSQLLEPNARSEVRVNALLTAEKPEALAEEARQAVAEGFQTLKLKVAGRRLAEDEARVRAVREAVGSQVNLRLDANGGWSEGEAAQALDRLSAYRPELCEQPIPANELQGLGRLQQQAPFPLAADEAIASPELFPLLLKTASGVPAARVFVLKPMVLGGLLPALRFAQQAAQLGLESFVTSSLDGVVSRAGASHLAAALPSGRLASGLGVGRLFVREEPPEHPFRPVQGCIRLPETPGLGLST